MGAKFDLYGHKEAGASVFSVSVRFITKAEEDVYGWALTQLCGITAAPLAGTQFHHGIICNWTVPEHVRAASKYVCDRTVSILFRLFVFDTSH